MKMLPAHFELMKAAIVAVDVPANRRAYKAMGFSLVRYQWDLFRAAKIEGDSTKWMCRVLYAYLTDKHIQTALNAIVEGYDND